MHLHLTGLTEEQFSRVNGGAMVRRAMGLEELSGYLRLAEAASLMLGHE